ncbi:hypothetical protein ASF27_12225 [Methylobacterium sp. Leaf102]|uniref:Uncharacterized protein n=2 Tax=Methylobacterium TaxID=407 RepID=A0A679JF88_9HYPH|nr:MULTISPECIES: hypothetical protein [Methylobacterium]GJE18511.1 hypothetical protein AIGOOFII_3239 [Methylobacterium marchantiae]KQP18587.1 hypothetical protein ASF25_12100 [Methylobacterium sp. Leaf100]KQP23928.1 hypothetical protein ASF27_12225 [Methylobacterium sp. Leaf102]MBD8903401.1 hypothetical protein [Methylobacterium bullatum]CAA2104539.1 hypothetical protein MBUL_02755 [Methylobacterium bullatum]
MPRCTHTPARLYDRHPDPVHDLIAVGSLSRFVRCTDCGARGIVRRGRVGWTPRSAGDPVRPEVERWNALVAEARAALLP